jgi:polyisoprenoid-binding protein YceI
MAASPMVSSRSPRLVKHYLRKGKGNVSADPLPLSRVIDGVHFPSAGAYQIDPVHTFVTFGAQHLVVGRVRGRFAVVAGTITVGDAPIDLAIDVAIDPASLTTLNDTRDNDLRSARFLDVVASRR